MLGQELVNMTTNLLSILSKKDALILFIHARDGFRAETDTPRKFNLTRKQYYNRLKQLVDYGLINKSLDEYKHTTLGSFVYQNHLLGLFEHIKNTKQMKMIDTLKQAEQFTEDEIEKFVQKMTGSSIVTNLSPKIEIVWSYEDMVSGIIERVEFCKREILLATRFLNEIIINNILRKAKGGVEVKVLADVSLVNQYLAMEKRGLGVIDEHTDERITVVANPWYPGVIDRRMAKIPYCLIALDGKISGIELIDWNNPEKFNGVIFIDDEKTCKRISDLYYTLWNNASENASVFTGNLNKNIVQT